MLLLDVFLISITNYLSHASQFVGIIPFVGKVTFLNIFEKGIENLSVQVRVSN